MIDLSLATIQDIVDELENRQMTVAIAVDYVAAGRHDPQADIPPENRTRCYGSKSLSKHPARMAAFLLDAIQWQLNLLDLTQIDSYVHVSMDGHLTKMHEVAANCMRLRAISDRLVEYDRDYAPNQSGEVG